jgi:YD repeat-containing protein
MYDPLLGVKTKATDANGQVVLWSYDGLGRLPRSGRRSGAPFRQTP